MRQYEEVNNYYLCEKVQIRPTSLLHYSYVMDLRNYEVGYTPTLRQNLNKEQTELDELNSIDDISAFGTITKYAEKYGELYKEKQLEVYNEKGHILKDLGTLSDTQVRNIKKYAILFADATKSNKDKYLSFVTLTLPSAQKHHDRVMRKILAKYLDHLKKVYGLKNYLWKAE
ncbi:rolling circle replication-associated protein, partial [Ornithobacterium rhinotracheale]